VAEPEGSNGGTRSLGISARERLERIEGGITLVLGKLDRKADAAMADDLSKRMMLVEAAQAGQASTAEFVTKAATLAEEVSKTARLLADETTKKAVELAEGAAKKATDLVTDQEEQKKELAALRTQLDGLDRKIAYYAGAAAAVALAGGVIVGKLFR
jgi:hypothetical protein